MCSGLVLIFLLACQWRAQVGSEGKGLGGQTGEDVLHTEEKSPYPVNDTIPGKKPMEFIKKVNGQEVILNLTGNYHKKLEFENREYPLEIKEVYPGIVYYDKYDTVKVLSYNRGDSTMIYPRVKDALEFYDQGRLVNRYVLDAHNPYLKKSKGVGIIKNFSNAEYESFLPPNKREEVGKVTEWQLHSLVENQGPLSKIIYFKKELVDGIWIVGAATTIVVLDSLGKELWNHEYPGHTSLPALSLDGTYALFAILPIETVNNSGIKTQTEGFEIWDTQTNTLLHREMNDDPNMWIIGATGSDNYSQLRTGYTYPNDKDISCLRIYFDYNKMVIHKRIFTTLEWNEISMNWYKKYKNLDGLMSHFIFQNYNLNYGN
ncbi:MAG: hypothetical protein Kow0027_28020 [Saprospiraceae bacterium]